MKDPLYELRYGDLVSKLCANENFVYLYKVAILNSNQEVTFGEYVKKTAEEILHDTFYDSETPSRQVHDSCPDVEGREATVL